MFAFRFRGRRLSGFQSGLWVFRALGIYCLGSLQGLGTCGVWGSVHCTFLRLIFAVHLSGLCVDHEESGWQGLFVGIWK